MKWPFFNKHHKSSAQILSEEDLIRAAQEDRRKFEALYNKYYEPVFRFAYQRLNDKETAYDITSQVFLNAMLNLKNYSTRGLPFSAWLFRITINELNGLFRKNNNAKAINVKMEQIHELIAEMKENDLELQDQLLTNALTELEQEDLQLIEMRFFEKRSFAEIGQILNITENNAKVKTYRVIDVLRKKMPNQKA
jgi:RNA polymerase sigma-70 factor, ECF subfamily